MCINDINAYLSKPQHIQNIVIHFPNKMATFRIPYIPTTWTNLSLNTHNIFLFLLLFTHYQVKLYLKKISFLLVKIQLTEYWPIQWHFLQKNYPTPTHDKENSAYWNRIPPLPFFKFLLGLVLKLSIHSSVCPLIYCWDCVWLVYLEHMKQHVLCITYIP